jgi:ubiquinone/menaquinone biosynthesis C-methylase UbiE
MSKEEQELGVCCADFYNHPLVVRLLDGILHPGGLAISSLMAKKMNLGRDSKVLDVACGDGKTASFIAKTTRSRVWGIDVGEEMIRRARHTAKEMGVSSLVNFQVALAGHLPFDDGEFSATYSECSICTLLDKQHSASEIARVLQPGGSLGVNDVTLQSQDKLDDELQGLFGRVACISDALSSEGYIDLFQEAGFTVSDVTHHSDLLTNLVKRAENNARLLRGVSESPNPDRVDSDTIEDILRICGLIHTQIETGNLGYDLFIFKKNE